jgi:predicted ATP-grasp superfamily ATP-dependent carboligase
VALAGLRHELSFPVAVKPIQSHRFTKVFGRKLFVVDSSFEELEAILRRCRERKLDVFLVEMIPGPDSLLSSYYTYRDQAGRCLFEFTKSVIRRWPVNRGNACFHKTGWLPETAAAGARFFESTGLMGLGNIEFKRDPRDGKLKIIEVNARFTAAQELLRRAGYPIDLVIYCHLTGQPLPALVASRRTLYFWYPLRDLLGFLELRRRGELSTWGWLRSIATTAHVFPLASLSDPLPMLGAGFAVARHALG